MRRRAGGLLTAGLLLVSRGADAAPVSSGWLAARRQLTACLSVAEGAPRAACLEAAAKALDAAEAQGGGPVPSPEQARTERAREFGSRRPAAPRQAARDSGLATHLGSAHQDRDGEWVMRTEEGATWAQTDGAYLVSPPHAGSSLSIRPGALGSFFCLIDTRREVRCKRRD